MGKGWLVEGLCTGEAYGGESAEEEGSAEEYEDELARELAAEEERVQMSWCWHEVVAKRVVDPVTGGCVCL